VHSDALIIRRFKYNDLGSGAMKRLPFVFLCAFSACTVGSPLATQSGGDDNMIDAAIDAANTFENGCVDPSVAIGAHHVHIVGGTSNAGQACVVSGCHLVGATGVNAPPWMMAGTVYLADNTTPNAGVIVTVTDAAMVKHTSVTDDNGNFYVQDDGSLTFPAQSKVTYGSTKCGTINSMSGALVATAAPATGNNCNGCHVPGGVAPQSTPISLAPQ
jgi:hypothetical protein